MNIVFNLILLLGDVKVIAQGVESLGCWLGVRVLKLPG